MTDGVANVYHNSTCYAEDLYQPNDGSQEENRAKDCAMFYGRIAAQNNVTMYTIGLGNAIDAQFLETLATLPGSGGQYYAAASTAQLDDIFDAILQELR